jgi:hypothetical protein
VDYSTCVCAVVVRSARWAAAVAILLASAAGAQQPPAGAQLLTTRVGGPLPASTASPTPAGFGPGIEILTTHTPPDDFASPTTALKSGLDIDLSAATTVGLNKLAERYGAGLTVLSVVPLVDIHDAVIAYDIDVALPWCPYLTYGEIATYWRDYCASRTPRPMPKSKLSEGDPPSVTRAIPDDSGLVIANITVSASYDYPTVRSFSRTPSNFYLGGWTAREIAAQALSVSGSVQLEKVYLTGPGARSYVFSAGGRRVVVEGQEPFAWYDYDTFLRVCLNNEQHRMDEVNQTLQQKGLDIKSVKDSIRTSNRAMAEALAASTKVAPAADHYIVGYPAYFQPLEWHYGSGPTAGAMVFEYWENSDWFGRLSYKYFREADAFEGDMDCHVASSQGALAIDMGTDAVGWTPTGNIYPGMVAAANAEGYCFGGGVDWYESGLFYHWSSITSEINAGHPFVWSFSWNSAFSGYQSMTAVGYSDAAYVICHSTLYYNGSQPIWIYAYGGPYDWDAGASPDPGCPVMYDVHLTSFDGYQVFGSCGSSGTYAGSQSSSASIRWNNWGRPGDHVNIWGSTDGGSNFTFIASAPDNGRYLWTIPCGINSSTCRIEIVQYSDATTYVSADGSYGDFTITPGPGVPATPTGLTFERRCNGFVLRWYPIAGATGYAIYRDGGLVSFSASTTFNYTGPAAYTQGCYTVSASNECSESGQSSPVCGMGFMVKPGVPSSLTCHPYCGAITMNWNYGANDATEYIIYRDGVRIDSTTGKTYVDWNPGQTQRCYSVTAKNDCGYSAQTPPTCCTAISGVPGVPSGLICVPGPGSIALNWNGVAGADGYVVYRDGSLFDSATTAACIDPAPGSAQRCYKVTAFNACGESAQSAQSCCTASPVWPDQVCVESKTVGVNSTGVTIGVWVKNVTALAGFVLPLEFRDTDGNGSYITGSCTFNIPTSNRIGASPLRSVYSFTRVMGAPIGPSELCPSSEPRCSGPVSSVYTTNSSVDFVSPDGFMWLGISSNGPPRLSYLPPGNDSVAGVFNDWPTVGGSTHYPAAASFNLVFNVNGTTGTFEIDTMCTCPANHLVGSDLSFSDVWFSFKKGVVTIVGCQGDPVCDGVVNVQDVVQTVGVAFRGNAAVVDPPCSWQRTDVNCDGATTVIDVVKDVNVAFRGGNPATEFCHPCL